MANWPNYKNFIYMEERGFIFAYVPKVACTNWKSLMRYMSGHEDWLDNKLAHDKVNGGIRYLDLSGSDSDLLTRADVRKYAMVRDPYSRILSAYLNKVEDLLPVKPETVGEDHFRKVVRDIDAFRRDRLGTEAFPTITFEVFLLWLKNSGSWFTKDEHWAPQSVLLRQPETTFDFVGRYENFEEDAQRMLSAMGCDERFPTQRDVQFPPTHARSKTERYFDENTGRLCEAIYAADFENFGYPIRYG